MLIAGAAPIERICERVAIHASIKADESMRAGNTGGERLWKRVLVITLRLRLSIPARKTQANVR